MINLKPLISLARSGGNPITLIKQQAQDNPIMAQAMRIIDGKTPEQLQETAINMAKERGTTVEQVARQIGLM